METSYEISIHSAIYSTMDNADQQPPAAPYRLALRPGHHGELDDVVVRDVAMFRAEQMDETSWWMACSLAGDIHDRISFSVRAVDGKLEVTVVEYPVSDVSYEAGSILEAADA